jgi:hypothetical protein
MMSTTLTAPDLTLVFLGIVVCLASALVWLFWTIEQRHRQRKHGRLR